MVTVILACRRETMSSTRTMSSSLERPITISPVSGRGNSPPWYFPEMKRSAKDRSALGGLVGMLGIGGSMSGWAL